MPAPSSTCLPALAAYAVCNVSFVLGSEILFHSYHELGIDGDHNQTGQMFAAMTGLPQATFASELNLNGGSVEVTREIDGGLETLSAPLPAVITTDLRLNEPRYASLPNIMKAKRKPLEELSVDDLGVEISNNVETISVELPPERQEGVKVESVDALIDKLKNEAKVI